MKAVALVFAVCAALVAQNNPAADFDRWFRDFQSAVVRKDAAAVTRGSKFPMQWEDGPTRDVKNADDFTRRFDFYFTADIKSRIASQKPVSGGGDTYSITWKARGNEYSIYFKFSG